MLLVSKLRVTVPHPAAPPASPDPVPPSDSASSAQSLNTPSAPLSVHALPSAVRGQPLFFHTRRRWHPRSLSYPPNELVPTFPSIHVALSTSYCVTGIHSVALALDWPHPCSLRTHSGPCPEQASGTFVRLSDRKRRASTQHPLHPPRYWKLDPAQVYANGPNAWDTAVHDASEEYKHRMVGGLLLRAGPGVGGPPQPSLTQPFPRF